jgi:hypothetical protein
MGSFSTVPLANGRELNLLYIMWRTDQETDFSTVIQRVMRRVTHITAASRSFKLARLPPWPAQRSGLSSLVPFS